MEPNKKAILMITLTVLCLIGILSIGMFVAPEKTTVKVTIPTQLQAGCACGSVPAPVPVKKYAIFWKDKDGYKACPTLFQTLEAASAAIPRDAEEARIVPVRID